jgi:hypothetical protein
VPASLLRFTAHAVLSLTALSSCFGTNIIWDLVDQGVFARAQGEFPSNFPLLGELSGTKLKDFGIPDVTDQK